MQTNQTDALVAAVRTMVLREMGAVKRELNAYPDDASVWRPIPGTTNTGGTLALHVAGNLQHFFGSVLAGDGYKRNRDAEFARRDVPRAALIAGIDAAIASIDRTLGQLTGDTVLSAYPEPIAKRAVATSTWLVHLAVHLAYHLGQIDYHRRTVTGDAQTIDAVSVRELPEIA